MRTKKEYVGSGWDAEDWFLIIAVIIGVALITTGIAVWVKEGFKSSILFLLGGVITCVLPFLFSVPALMKGKRKYEYPEAENRELTKRENASVILFSIAIYGLFVGLGVALSSILLAWRYDWGYAGDFLLYGLICAGALFFVFLFLAFSQDK